MSTLTSQSKSESAFAALIDALKDAAQNTTDPTAAAWYRRVIADAEENEPRVPTREELATILAALRFYQARGMCIPSNRSMDIHDVATDGGTVPARWQTSGLPYSRMRRKARER